jgi:hypothetical protein
MLKSKDVEDPVNVYVHRPLAYAFVWSIFKTRLTPNMVTLLAISLGLVSGAMFIWGTPEAMFMAGVCLWAAAILDGADGMLARAKKIHSEFGRALDGAADSIVAICTVFPAFYHIWVEYHNPYHLVLMVPAIGLTVVHLALYDFYKETFLRSSRPEGSEGSTSDEMEQLSRDAEDKPWAVRMAVNHVLIPHMRRQHALINFLNPHGSRLAELLDGSPEAAEIYRKYNLGPMRLWAVISLAPHTYLMAICAMTNRLDIYLFIRVFVMNGVFLVVALWQRHATAETIKALSKTHSVRPSEAKLQLAA